MKTIFGIAAAILALAIARGALAQGGNVSTLPGPPLDQFTTRYGFPTFPALSASGPAVPEVPFIYYGPNYKDLRIGDLTKVPLTQSHATPASPPPVSPPPPPPPPGYVY